MEIKVRIQLPYEVEWVIGKIRDAGYEAFAVGGCVGCHHLRKAGGSKGDF